VVRFEHIACRNEQFCSLDSPAVRAQHRRIDLVEHVDADLHDVVQCHTDDVAVERDAVCSCESVGHARLASWMTIVYAARDRVSVIADDYKYQRYGTYVALSNA